MVDGPQYRAMLGRIELLILGVATRGGRARCGARSPYRLGGNRMSLVRCPQKQCSFWLNGWCDADEIELDPATLSCLTFDEIELAEELSGAEHSEGEKKKKWIWTGSTMSRFLKTTWTRVCTALMTAIRNSLTRMTTCQKKRKCGLFEPGFRPKLALAACRSYRTCDQWRAAWAGRFSR